MRLKLPTITVAVCAYNEAENIIVLLESILRQKSGGYLLKEIRVISDGSTGKTVSLYRDFQKKYPIIRVIAHRIRLEKYFDTSLSQREFYVLGGILLKYKVQLLLTHPVSAVFIYVLNLISAINAVKQEKVLTGTWTMATTTKHHIINMPSTI